jgi:hypothetical protein
MPLIFDDPSASTTLWLAVAFGGTSAIVKIALPLIRQLELLHRLNLLDDPFTLNAR